MNNLLDAAPWQLRRWPQLARHANPVPFGFRPLPGVNYGCGTIGCRVCYEPDPDPQPLVCPKCGQEHDDANEDVVTCLGCSYDFSRP
jgi:hypothetical protein